MGQVQTLTNQRWPMIGRFTLRNALGVLAPTGLFQRLPDSRPCILMYHCVGRHGYGHIDASVFDAHLTWLKRHYDIVALADIQTPGPRKRVALTFDDGLLSFQEEVVPLLEKHGVHATVFVIGRTLAHRKAEDDATFMTAAQVRNLVRHPLVAVGSHTMNHVRLTKLDSGARVRAEIADAADLLQDLTGCAVDGFCYPYTDWNPAVREQVAAFHRYAVCGMGDFRMIDSTTPPLSLPRIDGAVGLNALRFKVSDAWKRYNESTMPEAERRMEAPA